MRNARTEVGKLQLRPFERCRDVMSEVHQLSDQPASSQRLQSLAKRRECLRLRKHQRHVREFQARSYVQKYKKPIELDGKKERSSLSFLSHLRLKRPKRIWPKRICQVNEVRVVSLA